MKTSVAAWGNVKQKNMDLIHISAESIKWRMQQNMTWIREKHRFMPIIGLDLIDEQETSFQLLMRT